MGNENIVKEYVLVGAGIMSATLGVLLKETDPDSKITIIERLKEPARESSASWNNAGTGHGGMCEMNYTPERPDGSIDTAKALKVNEEFEISKQFWAWLVAKNKIAGDFITSTPHISFVFGEKDIAFLEKRVEAMKKFPQFNTMAFSKDREVLKKWVPLMMKDRPQSDKVAASRMIEGADVNYGYLTNYLLKYLASQKGVVLITNCEAKDIRKSDSGKKWIVKCRDFSAKQKKEFRADFVFIGAGGRALNLLQKTKIPESKGYGGFPVSGLWLICANQEVVSQHNAKVYGKAALGAPPMSVPHLDRRKIKGEKELLFGPFAGFSTKFLKHGSYWDFFRSLGLGNLIPMMQVGIHNFSLIKYLVSQVLLRPQKRLEELRKFYPDAKMKDWKLSIAGQRVQIIKDEKTKGGTLEFGTEVVHSADGSVAALLGASPGASTSVYIILDVLKSSFPELLQKESVLKKLKEMIPSYGTSLQDHGELLLKIRENSHRILGLKMGKITDLEKAG